MSYLSQLQEALRAPTPFGAALSRVGQSALEYSAADLAQRQQEEIRRQQEKQRNEQMAQRQAEFIQQRLPDMRRAGMFKEMAGLLPTYRQATKTAYGIDIPGGDVVGAPIYGPPQPALPRIDAQKMPSGIPGLRPRGSEIIPGELMAPSGQAAPLPPREIGRDFSGAMTRRALDERFMLAPEMPKYQQVGGALFDPENKEFLVPPTQLTAEQKMTTQRERNITNLKRQEISTGGALERAGLMARAGITRANIGASASLTRAQISAQQQELNRAQRASQFADALEARINMFGENLAFRKTAAEQKINTEIAKAAPGALSNVTNQLKGQKLEAAITTVTDENGLPNYVMSLDSPDAVQKARAAAQANGFAVGAYTDDPNTVVLMPQRGMQKEIPLIETGAGTYGQKVVGATAKAPTVYEQGPGGKLTAIKATPGKQFTPPAKAAPAQAGGAPRAKTLSPKQKEDQAHITAEKLFYRWSEGLPEQEKIVARKQLAMLGSGRGGREGKKRNEKYQQFFINALEQVDNAQEAAPATGQPRKGQSVEDLYLGK